MNSDDEIYKKLKQLRKDRGMTLADVADRIGSDYQQLSRIERGKSRLTVETLVKMAEAFDIPVDTIFKAEFEENKEASRTAKKSPKDFQENSLKEILEKLEIVIQETNCFLTPQTKANLASMIYQKSLENNSIIDFSMSIIKSTLQNYTQ